MSPDEIQRLIREGRYEVSIHAQQERLEDDLDIEEIELAVLQGDLIEDYPTDPRGPSCLVGGLAGANPIHVVLARIIHDGSSRKRADARRDGHSEP